MVMRHERGAISKSVEEKIKKEKYALGTDFAAGLSVFNKMYDGEISIRDTYNNFEKGSYVRTKGLPHFYKYTAAKQYILVSLRREYKNKIITVNNIKKVYKKYCNLVIKENKQYGLEVQLSLFDKICTRNGIKQYIEKYDIRNQSLRALFSVINNIDTKFNKKYLKAIAAVIYDYSHYHKWKYITTNLLSIHSGLNKDCISKGIKILINTLTITKSKLRIKGGSVSFSYMINPSKIQNYKEYSTKDVSVYKGSYVFDQEKAKEKQLENQRKISLYNIEKFIDTSNIPSIKHVIDNFTNLKDITYFTKLLITAYNNGEYLSKCTKTQNNYIDLSKEKPDIYIKEPNMQKYMEKKHNRNRKLAAIHSNYERYYNKYTAVLYQLRSSLYNHENIDREELLNIYILDKELKHIWFVFNKGIETEETIKDMLEQWFHLYNKSIRSTIENVGSKTYIINTNVKNINNVNYINIINKISLNISKYINNFVKYFRKHIKVSNREIQERLTPKQKQEIFNRKLGKKTLTPDDPPPTTTRNTLTDTINSMLAKYCNIKQDEVVNNG